jgi:uncharacterized membrane protein YdjX (TVP38/TMEM64 family)
VKLFSVAFAALLVIAAIFLWAFGLKDYLSFAYIQSAGESMHAWLEIHPVTGPLAYYALYSALIVMCIPAAAIMTLTAGFLFGLWLGVLLVLAASITGTTLLFLLAQSSAGGIFRRHTEKFYRKYAEPMRKDAFHYIIFSRLVPGLPSPVANILPALFDVPLKTYMAATFIGIFPSTVVFVYLGQALGTAGSVSDLVTGPVLAGFAALAVLSLGPLAFRKARERRVSR